MRANSSAAHHMDNASTIAPSVLIHCRTVVEKKDFVSTGVLTYAEGDMPQHILL